MQKCILSGLIILLAASSNINAQFLPAMMPEANYPLPNNACERAHNTACYSFGDVYFPADNTQDDLYVYSWDGGSTGGYLNYGIGWRRVQTGTSTILNQGYIVPLGSRGIDVGIIDMNGSPFVIAGYYKAGVGHVLDYYKWAVNTLALVNTEVLSHATTYSPVQIDAHRLYGYAVTWADGGKVHVRAGRTDSGPLLGCDIVLNQGGSYHFPDIAIGHGGSTGSGLTLHFTYTSTNNQQVIESTLPFDDVHLNCPFAMIPVVEDIQTASPGNDFGVSRIDCPDHSQTDDWSYVVPENNKIRAGIMAYSVSSSPQHAVLNDGSLGNPNISIFANDKPVIAYDNTGEYIYYCWWIQYPFPGGGSAGGYIGLKLKNNTVPLTFSYWEMLQNQQYTSHLHSIALSGQNDQNTRLYSVFTLYENITGYHIGYKHIPWNWSSFRPDPAHIPQEKNIVSGMEIFPNPYIDGFSLNNTSDDGRYTYQVRIADISGRSLHFFKGNLKEINRNLRILGKEQVPGMYFVHVEAGGASRSFKIVKK